MNAKKKKLIKQTALVALACGLIGGAFAYFSAVALQKVNTVSVATGEKDKQDGIEIVEPSWHEPDHVTGSNELIPKDPSVVSKVSYDGWAIMRVRIPKVMSIVNGQEPNAEGAVVDQLNEIAELRYYNAPQIDVGAANILSPASVENLTVVGSYNSSKFVPLGENTANEEYNEYYYGYKDILPAGGRTENLFDFIKVRDFKKLTNGDDAKIDTHIDVDARLVQATDPDTGKSFVDVEDAFNKIYKANAAAGEFGNLTTAAIRKITFDANGATGNAFEQPIDEAVADNAFTRTGYTFTGWNTAADGSGESYAPGAAYTGDAAGTLYAQWSKDTYTISYNLDGGSVATANASSYDVETDTFALNNPTRTGYTFKGWSGTGLTGDENQSVSITNGSTGNKEYTANWTPVKYTITYNLDGGSVATANKTEYNIETDTFTLTNPTKDGYEFTGWTGTGLSAATTSVSIVKGSTGNREYTANWKKKITPVGTLSLKSNDMDATGINKIGVYQPDTKKYEYYSPYATVPVYAGEKVALYHSETWRWYYRNNDNAYLGQGKACHFTVPSNASGDAELWIANSGTSDYILYDYNTSGWVRSSACYPTLGE